MALSRCEAGDRITAAYAHDFILKMLERQLRDGGRS
jgi:hypothetical protein